MRTRMLKFLTVMLMLAALSGCGAPVALGKLYADVESEPVGDDVARLIIYYNGYPGISSFVNVKIDDAAIGRLQNYTFRRHTVAPGNVRISADARSTEGKVIQGTLILVTVGVAAKDVKKANARRIVVPADASVRGGEEYFFRVDKNNVTVMEECHESRGEARLCEVTKFETRVSPIPSDRAKQEIMMFSEVVDERDQ